MKVFSSQSSCYYFSRDLELRRKYNRSISNVQESYFTFKVRYFSIDINCNQALRYLF